MANVSLSLLGTLASRVDVLKPLWLEDDMTLEAYLRDESLSLGEFARRIGARNARTVQRYVKGLRIPSVAMMGAIQRETDGKVQPNDFFAQAEG